MKERKGGFELETTTPEKKDRILYSKNPAYVLVLKPTGSTMLVKDQTGQMVSHQSQGLVLKFAGEMLPGCDSPRFDHLGRVTGVEKESQLRGYGYFDRTIDRFNATGGHIDDDEREIIWDRITGKNVNGIPNGYGVGYGDREMAQRMGGLRESVKPVNPATVDESTLVA